MRRKSFFGGKAPKKLLPVKPLSAGRKGDLDNSMRLAVGGSLITRILNRHQPQNAKSATARLKKQDLA
jgi:hypothetical protein